MYARNVSFWPKSNMPSDYMRSKCIPFWFLIGHASNQREKDHSGNFSVQIERRTHSVIRAPVNSIEHAMDIAIGAEGKPWIERNIAA